MNLSPYIILMVRRYTQQNTFKKNPILEIKLKNPEKGSNGPIAAFMIIFGFILYQSQS